MAALQAHAPCTHVPGTHMCTHHTHACASTWGMRTRCPHARTPHTGRPALTRLQRTPAGVCTCRHATCGHTRGHTHPEPISPQLYLPCALGPRGLTPARCPVVRQGRVLKRARGPRGGTGTPSEVEVKCAAQQGRLCPGVPVLSPRMGTPQHGTARDPGPAECPRWHQHPCGRHR